MVIFFLFSFFLILFAMISVFRKDTLEASIAFLCSVFCVSALFILSRAEFLAIATLISYTGLTIIIFLFTFLSMDTKERSFKRRFFPLGIITSIVFLIELGIIFLSLFSSSDCFFCNSSVTLSSRDYPMKTDNNVWELSYLLFHDLWFLVIVSSIILFLITLCIMSISTIKDEEREDK